jgi:hypothetical protein
VSSYIDAHAEEGDETGLRLVVRKRSRSTTRIEGGQQTLSNLAAYVTEIVRKGVEE